MQGTRSEVTCSAGWVDCMEMNPVVAAQLPIPVRMQAAYGAPDLGCPDANPDWTGFSDLGTDLQVTGPL